MLMPGRYAAADTSITQVTMTYNTFYEFGTPSGMAMASGMTSGNAQATDVDGALYLTVDSLGDGIAYETGVTPGQYHELQFDAQYIMGAPFRAYVTEERLDSNQERYQFELCSTFMPVEGKYVVAFTPTMAAVTLHVDYGGSGTAGSSGTGPGSGGPAMAGGSSPGRSAGLVKIDLTPVDRADPTTEVRVVKNVKDLYRFGFNGQEKDNEIYGRGTHYYAPFWGYDSRTGRRWNLDPVDQINISNYATFADNPILLVDFLGNKVGFNSEKERSLVVDKLTNPDSKDYNPVFTERFKKLEADEDNLFVFNEWKEAPEEQDGNTIEKTYGQFSYSGTENNMNKFEIGYTIGKNSFNHSLSALFEETDHAGQFLENRIGFFDFADGNGFVPSISYDIYDEVDNKIFSVRASSAFNAGSKFKEPLFGLEKKIRNSNFDREKLKDRLINPNSVNPNSKYSGLPPISISANKAWETIKSQHSNPEKIKAIINNE